MAQGTGDAAGKHPQSYGVSYSAIQEPMSRTDGAAGHLGRQAESLPPRRPAPSGRPHRIPPSQGTLPRLQLGEPGALLFFLQAQHLYH